ncbi:hypothetical protein ACWJKH_00020 (plasmid) [Xanthomonas axonopodis pv. cassiae]|uniref:hypothetical protein n=1 Tax=Xanthomonas TaxID=338 RepID=UPI0004E7B81E|nr:MULTISPECIES: hypothetical protein [Xanthomonas]MBV6690432.1 hypothetical protein [Xanthomonas euvesicatoria pv. physalidis]MBV6778819.1 hypothetical protein [Xanthomonas campestris pv. carissae]MBV6791780.1 hypothetical protein [Xanthomonas campestris pv. clerodendri]WPM78941.1 hypothetical protein XVT_21800 [Xanthomonas citri pv. viticola]CEI18813.1 conserved hypothetical protein [Xanthomonas citri pv. citri]
MTKTSVADVLRELAKGDKSRSETARLRDVIDEVEAAIAAGVSRSAVLEALHGQGFTMTLKSFESALYRIRKQRGQGAVASPTAPPAVPLRHDEKGGEVAPAASKKAGEFEIPVPKRFTHNPKPDDDLLK